LQFFLETSVESEQPPPYDYSIMANDDCGSTTETTTPPKTVVISTTANGYRDKNPVA